ncbi:MAG: hypothetical protein V2J26_09490 [Pacificimonas sp.]|jgi:hypothetical protein|nr:hypothetical protein [Pacificimonas sp.]
MIGRVTNWADGAVLRAALPPALVLGAMVAAPAAPVTAQIPTAVVSDSDADDLLSGEGDTLAENASASERLFRALRDGEEGEAVDLLIGQALTEVDARCTYIERYQVFSRVSSFITMKVKCAERPVYTLTVGAVGLGAIAGGDGTVERIRAGEGEIRILEGEAPEPARPVGSGSLEREFPVRTIAAVFGALVLLSMVLIWMWSRRQQAVAQWRGLHKDDKDRMLAESDEVEHDLFQHPDGVWIARGRRGKRRFFMKKFYARLYRDRGLKIMQVR